MSSSATTINNNSSSSTVVAIVLKVEFLPNTHPLLMMGMMMSNLVLAAADGADHAEHSGHADVDEWRI